MVVSAYVSVRLNVVIIPPARAGPFYRMTGHFRNTVQIRTNNLTVPKPFLDRKIIRQYSEIDTSALNLNDKIVFEERYARRESELLEGPISPVFVNDR